VRNQFKRSEKGKKEGFLSKSTTGTYTAVEIDDEEEQVENICQRGRGLGILHA
jgi:hypothetical protein